MRRQMGGFRFRRALRGLPLTRLPPNGAAYVKQVAGLLRRGVENSPPLGASAGASRSTLAERAAE